MRICIPVNSDQGLESEVCAHFGSAPAFLLVDADSGECKGVTNSNQHHNHGMCSPLAALAHEKFDAIVVGGIGMGALAKLQAANIKVFRSSDVSVKQTIESLKNGKLVEVEPHMACTHHG